MNDQVHSLKHKFRKITIIPFITFGIITIITSSFMIYNSMHHEAEDDLKNLSHALSLICELSGSGDYHIVDNILYKGDQPFDASHVIVDTMKSDSNVDATIFLGNRRISTTVTAEHGDRIIGTTASDEVQEAVLNKGKEFFSDRVKVNGIPYYGQYVPLRDSKKAIVGMLFVGKPRTAVLHTIFKSIATMSTALLIMIIFMSFLSLSFSGKIVNSLNKIREFLSKITQGDVYTPLDEAILQRNDEIGEMGRFSVMLQKSVTELINTDTLTGLYNRRSTQQFLERAIRDHHEQQIPFTIVIGDIDDFKHINDTYGHAIGDEVLRSIAAIFLTNCRKDDIVARWGGEEFLFILKHADKKEAKKRLKILQEHIHHMQCSAEEHHDIRVTMTFGTCEYHEDFDLEEILKKADNRLYYGKRIGKDKIISCDEELQSN